MPNILKFIKNFGKLTIKLPKVTKFVSESYTSLLRPATWEKNFAAQEAMFAEMAKTGAFFEKATIDHADVKIAGLAKALEEMLEHPLSKRFIKEKPDIYIIKGGASSTLEALMGTAGSPRVTTPKTIMFPQQAIEALEHPELKAVLAHELGHIIRADAHPNRGIKNLVRPANQQMERNADQIGVLLCGNAEATKNGLTKIMALTQQSFSSSVQTLLPKPIAIITNSIVERTMKYGTRQYPGLTQRKKLIEKTAKMLGQDGEKSFLEQEVTRRIANSHQEANITLK